MSDIVEDRLLLQNRLREVKQMRQWVLDAEQSLSADCGQAGSEVSNARGGQQFDIWRQQLRQQMMQTCLSQAQEQCLEQFLQVLSNQRSHLLECSDQKKFPRTNHEMERRIRSIKTRYRRISGRKNWNSYLLRYGRDVAFYDWWEQDAQRSHQFLHQAAQLDRALWRKHRQESRTARSSHLKRFRFRHRRQAYLAELEVRWEATPPTLLLP